MPAAPSQALHLPFCPFPCLACCLSFLGLIKQIASQPQQNALNSFAVVHLKNKTRQLHFVPQPARDGVATQMQPRFLFCHRTWAPRRRHRGRGSQPGPDPRFASRAAAPIPRRIPKLGLEFQRPARRHMQDEVGVLASTQASRMSMRSSHAGTRSHMVVVGSAEF